MGQPHNGAGDEKNITERRQEQRQNQTTCHDQYLHRGRFRFRSQQGEPAFKKLYERAYERQEVLEQTRVPRRIAGPRALADHLRKFSELAPEDQTQNKPDSERGKDRLRWIFAHVLLRVFLERTGAISRIPPCLFCFAACFAPLLLCLAAIFFSES